jgi:hypothetical protein
LGEGSADPGEGNLTSSLTWDWDNRFDKYTNTGSNTKSITQGASGTEETIDVTDIVTSWFNGSNNYGVILINDSSESNDAKALLFFSSESSGNKPYLVVNYTTNTAPSAPTITAPYNSLTSSLPTFSGSMSDVDAGDYITAVQIQVQKLDERYQFSTTTSSGDPGTGKIRFNNATAAAITAVYISETTYDSLVFATGGLVSGGTLRVFNASALGSDFVFNITGAPTDNGT